MREETYTVGSYTIKYNKMQNEFYFCISVKDVPRINFFIYNNQFDIWSINKAS